MPAAVQCPWSLMISTDYPPNFGTSRHLSEEELVASLVASLRDWDGISNIWLFGYGSLIWKPELSSVESCRAHVHGYHRGLYLWSSVNRGTPKQPGLVLALDRGGSCVGIAYQLPADGLYDSLLTLWRREMPMESYQPTWMKCHLFDGRKVSALSFVIRRNIPSYAGTLPDAVLQKVLSHAHGSHGTTHDYVVRTVSALRSHQMPDIALEAILRRCGSRITGDSF